jgi:hypothetical protein
MRAACEMTPGPDPRGAGDAAMSAREAVLQALLHLVADARDIPGPTEFRLLWAMIEYLERATDRRAAEALATLCDALVDWEAGKPPPSGVVCLVQAYVRLHADPDGEG